MTTPTNILPPLPQSWSALTWQQLCDVWTVKMRYGGNPDVAQAAALLALCAGSKFNVQSSKIDEHTGEQQYIIEAGTLSSTSGRLLPTGRKNLEPGALNQGGKAYVVTARELAWMARQALPWFPYPYGDPGKEAVKDDKGKVVEESVPPHRGYVSGMRDAMILSEEQIVIIDDRIVPNSQWLGMSEQERQQIVSLVRLPKQEILHSSLFTLHYALPRAAMNNLTWEQYRSMQATVPMLFREGLADGEALRLQAEFLSYCLVPEGQPDATGNPFHYSAVVAEQTQPLWLRMLESGSPLFQICFQCYQTAMGYYREAFPLLFMDGGKSNPLEDALVGEVNTLNAIMKYQGYIRQQDVYETNLPIVFSVLNTMTREAKEIEKMNAKIKRK